MYGFGQQPQQTTPFGQTPNTQTGFAFGQQQQQQPQQTGAFGSGFGAAAKPTFGTSTFGAGSSFGTPSTPAFGSTGSAFGATSTPTFGAATPAFGATTSTPAFGSTAQQGAFGSSAFNATPTFGTPAQTGFGTAQPSFGTSTFGSGSTFGSTGTTFGAPATQPAAASSFGFGGSQNAFGSSTSSFGVQTGTGTPPYTDTVENENGSNYQMKSISAMPAYKNKSYEELRLEDYLKGKKPFGASSGFGTSSTGTSAFGTAQPSTSAFGTAQPTTSAFGTTQPATIGFGSTQPAASGFGGFGGASTAPSFSSGSGFGATTATQPSSFNPAATSAFGTPAATSGFSSSTTPAFSGGTTGFGSSGFGTGASGFSFGQPQAQPQTTGFGATTGTTQPPTFGVATTTTTPSFGQPATAQTTSFGFPSAATQQKPFSFPSSTTTQPSTFGTLTTPSTSFQPTTGGFQFNTPTSSTAAKPFSFGPTTTSTPQQTAQPMSGFSFNTSTPSAPTLQASIDSKPYSNQLFQVNVAESAPSTRILETPRKVTDTPQKFVTPRSAVKVVPRAVKTSPKISLQPEEKAADSFLPPMFTPRASAKKLVIEPSSLSSQKLSFEAVEQEASRINTPSRRLEEATFTPLKKIDESLTLTPKATRKILRDDYFVEPSLDTLKQMSYKELSNVSDFTVGRLNYGSVKFLEPVNLTDVNMDEIAGDIVQLEHKQVTVYPNEGTKPEAGQQLNVPARVELHRCYPLSKSTKEPITDMSNEVLKKHISKLKEIEDTEFIEYFPKEGTWIFQVSHFSRYGLEDEQSTRKSSVENSECSKRMRKTRAVIHKEECLVDAGLFMGRSFRVGWGKDKSFTQCNTYNVNIQRLNKQDLLEKKNCVLFLELLKGSEKMSFKLIYRLVENLESISKSEKAMWSLCAALFDPLEIKDKYLESQRRRALVCAWVQQNCKSVSKIAKDPLQVIYDLLCSFKVKEACLHALNHKYLRLATLIPQIGCDDSFKESIKAESDSNPLMQNILKLLGGNVEEACRGLDWVNSFGLFLFYKVNQCEPLQVAVDMHRESVLSGTLCKENIYSLLVDNTCSMESILGSTNQRVAFLLSVLLKERELDALKKDKLCLAFVFELEANDLFEHALYTASFIQDKNCKQFTLGALLQRNPEKLSVLPEEVPSSVWHESLALYAQSRNDYVEQSRLLIAANRLEEAHKILVEQVAPQLIIQGEYEQLEALLQPLQSLLNWKKGAQVYLDYINFCEGKDNDLRSTLPYLRTDTLKKRVCAAEIASQVNAIVEQRGLAAMPVLLLEDQRLKRVQKLASEFF